MTDRVNSGGEIYGIDRLKEAALRARGDSARITLYSLPGEIQGWADGVPAEDVGEGARGQWAGTRAFSSSNQFCTTLIRGEPGARVAGYTRSSFFPSFVTS